MNAIWEMAQMSAYVETAGHSWASTLGLCTRAAVGDVGIILGIYGAGALAAGDLRWGAGAPAGTLTPQRPFWGWLVLRWWNMRRWSYTDRMPVVSVFSAGLWPLLQMTLLPPLTFLFARWWTGRNVTKDYC